MAALRAHKALALGQKGTELSWRSLLHHTEGHELHAHWSSL